MITLQKVNNEIRASTSPHIELVQGLGYYHLVYNNGRRYSTTSIRAGHINQFPLATWVEKARCFYTTLGNLKG